MKILNNFILRLRHFASQHSLRTQLILAIALILLYFLPLFQSPAHTIPSTCADAWQAVWNAWWIKYWLAHPGTFLYYTPFLFHPHGVGLYLHTMYAGSLLPLALLGRSASPETLYSAACILLFFANFVSSRLFFSELGLEAKLVFIFSALFTFSPFFIGHLNGGHLALLFFFPVLLILTAFLRLQKGTLGKGFAILSALALGLAVYADMYFIYFTALFLPVLGACFWALRLISIRKLFIFGMLLAFVSGPIVLTKAIPVDKAYASKEYSPNRKPFRYPTPPLLYFFPGDNQWIWSAIPDGIPYKKTTGKVPAGAGAYLGYSLLLLSLLGLLKYKRGFPDSKIQISFLATSFVFFILATGPTINVFSEQYPNPFFTTLFDALPHFPSVPLRFTIIGEIFLFGAAALALKGMRLSRSHSYFQILVLVLALIEFFPRPLLTSTLEPTPVLTLLKQDQAIKGIIDASPYGKISMFRQMFHEKPITEGYVSRRPLKNFEAAKKNPLINYIRKGNNADFEELHKIWESFEVQAIVVNKSNFLVYNRISALPWLRKRYEDQVVAVFAELG